MISLGQSGCHGVTQSACVPEATEVQSQPSTASLGPNAPPGAVSPTSARSALPNVPESCGLPRPAALLLCLLALLSDKVAHGEIFCHSVPFALLLTVALSCKIHFIHTHLQCIKTPLIMGCWGVHLTQPRPVSPPSPPSSFSPCLQVLAPSHLRRLCLPSSYFLSPICSLHRGCLI